MKLSPIFVGLSLALAAQASWFGSDSSNDKSTIPYTTWSASQLRDWLEIQGIPVPSRGHDTETDLRSLVKANWDSSTQWTYDQYASAQKSFTDLRDDAFDKWDDSKLRQWLLEQGVVAPKGPREKLVLMAKERWRAYNAAASSFSSMATASASSIGSRASDSASSVSAKASTAVYGDSAHQASKSISSKVAEASADAARRFDETKDYIYSTWDENGMRAYLEEKGVLKTKTQTKKDELLNMMHQYYGRVADPIWNTWSDTYLHHWLVAHNIIDGRSQAQKRRDELVALMKNYYYNGSESVWHSWTDSNLRQWLVEHDIVKDQSAASGLSRDKMIKMVEDNYINAKDTFWNAWSDVQIKEWLVNHGYMRSDAQVKRDELIKLANEKYNNTQARTAAYLAWPDARLRAYLREHGVSEDMVPGGRPGLLQEVRIRYIQAENRAENVLEKIKDLVNGGAHKVEDVLANVFNILTLGWSEGSYHARRAGDAANEKYDDLKRAGRNSYDAASEKADEAYDDARGKWQATEEGYDDIKQRTQEELKDAQAKGKGWADRKWGDARENVGEKIKTTGSKVKGEL